MARSSATHAAPAELPPRTRLPCARGAHPPTSLRRARVRAAGWRRHAERLQLELGPLRLVLATSERAGAASPPLPPADDDERAYTSGGKLAEAARWHAEARAFAAEARRVERAQRQLGAERDAEREGWRDFTEQVRGRYPSPPRGVRPAAGAAGGGALASGGGGGGGGLSGGPDAPSQQLQQLGQARAALAQAKAEADELMRQERSVRLQVDQAGRRLDAMEEMARQLDAVV